MVWSHYVSETYLTEVAPGGEIPDDGEEYVDTLDYQDWITMNSDDLYNMWFSIKEYRENTGCILLQTMDWNDFCEFVYKFST